MPGENKKMCPISSLNPHNDDGKCIREECEWWRGNKKNGSCAVWDISGWIQHLYSLAKDGKIDKE